MRTYDYRGLRENARQEHGITWGIVRSQRLHLGCATEDELLLTWAGFHGDNHPDASKPCERCHIPLSEVPDP